MDKTKTKARKPGADPEHIPQDRIDKLNAYWRAANYLGAAQLYLKENPLLREPLKVEHIKKRLLGHWGTQPGLNMIYTHLNRLILDTDASILLVVGPGHGAPAILANLFLEGTFQEYYEEIKFDIPGLTKFVRQFSWPYGMPSHLFPGTPGMIHEGGELGYSLTHAYGAVLDNPDLISVCIVGDGEAETGPLATAWHSNKYLDPATSGAVLPILHLNGYKLSGPTIMGRMSDEELVNLFNGYGYQVHIVSGDEPDRVHRLMWNAVDWAYAHILEIQKQAREEGNIVKPEWPMIILRTPKGWTCPHEVDGHQVEGTFHAHQIPVMNPQTNDEHRHILEAWLRSYKPEELFTDDGKPVDDVTSQCPTGARRIGMNEFANGGNLLTPLKMPDYTDYAIDIAGPASCKAEGTKQLAKFIRDIFDANKNERNLRFFCPDETTSNRMEHIFESTGRAFMWPLIESDEWLSQDGRVMEILSEHTCQGWLEGYLLTGRHGFFACYEAFIPIIDSMLNQYAKWLKVSKEVPWRKPLSSLNYLLTSHVWRQDHNGYTHQVPSFINNVANKKSSVARIYLPPDANCLLSVADHCLRSRDYVNLIVASKQLIPQWLDMKTAKEHCARGISEWEWAGNKRENPEIILACAGDVPTEELIAAAQFLRKELPDLATRVINVVDLMSLMAPQDHPHGMEENKFNELFTEDTHVIFAFHGYPRVVHELVHHRPNPVRFHVHGYKEEGRTTTPFDMRVLNHLSRYHLVKAAIDRVPGLKDKGQAVKDKCDMMLTKHTNYIKEHGVDMPEIRDWKWEG